MGLYEDQTNSLSEIKRLAALVMSPDRRGDIGADQWPLAIVAYGLVTCNQTVPLSEVLEVYGLFESNCVSADVRARTCLQLARFITQRQGDGWRTLVGFVCGDSAEVVRRQAGFLMLTLARPTQADAFPGLVHLLDLVVQYAQQADVPPTMAAPLAAVLNTADLRLLERCTRIVPLLPEGYLASLISNMVLTPNALAIEWLLAAVQGRGIAVQEAVVASLQQMPTRGTQVLDVIVPMPTWQFKDATVQPLHFWSLPEFSPRIQPRLIALLGEDLARVALLGWA